MEGNNSLFGKDGFHRISRNTNTVPVDRDEYAILIRIKTNVQMMLDCTGNVDDFKRRLKELVNEYNEIAVV